jgi:hypothetical protein
MLELDKKNIIAHYSLSISICLSFLSTIRFQTSSITSLFFPVCICKLFIMKRKKIILKRFNHPYFNIQQPVHIFKKTKEKIQFRCVSDFIDIHSRFVISRLIIYQLHIWRKCSRHTKLDIIRNMMITSFFFFLSLFVFLFILYIYMRACMCRSALRLLRSS